MGRCRRRIGGDSDGVGAGEGAADEGYGVAEGMGAVGGTPEDAAAGVEATVAAGVEADVEAAAAGTVGAEDPDGGADGATRIGWRTLEVEIVP